MGDSDNDFIPVSRPSFLGNESSYVNDAVSSGWVSSKGKYVDIFEKKLAEYTGSRHCSSCSNGTVALHLALLALGIGKGDEVIVPTLTYIASANAVAYVGADVIFADSGERSFNMDVDKLERLITNRTKAIVVVHLYGVVVDMDKVLKLADKYGLFVVEDAAEAIGATYQGTKVGAIGDIGTFSFFGNKIVTCGEGGAVLTSNSALAEKISVLKNQGQSETKRFWHDVVGYNYRMTNMQAALGVAQLERLAWCLSERERIANIYEELLISVENVAPVVKLDHSSDVCWLYTVKVGGKGSINVKHIEKVISRLELLGIETRPFFYPLHTMDIHYREAEFPLAVKYNNTCLCLPTWVGITEAQQFRVVEALSKTVAEILM